MCEGACDDGNHSCSPFHLAQEAASPLTVSAFVDIAGLPSRLAPVSEAGVEPGPRRPLGIYVGSREPNSGLDACAAIAFATEPAP